MTSEAPATALATRLRALARNADRVYVLAQCGDLVMDRDDYRVMRDALNEAAEAISARVDDTPTSGTP